MFAKAYDDVISKLSGGKFGGKNTLYPNVYDGVDGMNFITRCVSSSTENGNWVSLNNPACRA